LQKVLEKVLRKGEGRGTRRGNESRVVGSTYDRRGVEEYEKDEEAGRVTEPMRKADGSMQRPAAEEM
jgi:hypothetical protein